jgi:DtxR family transcriptional regulator, Mn-dependent transcriptional regulator
VTTTPSPTPLNPGHTSESEEMYLITVARAHEEGQAGPVPVAVLAKNLHVSVASANEMVRKLSARGLLDYEPYHGAELTAEGAVVAGQVLRTRRLWATFLADHLGLSPQEADDQACLLEHVTLPDATSRLASFLGDPATGPLGHPIPHDGAAPASAHQATLAEAGAGTRGEVVGITASPAATAFLAAEGIEAGTRLVVEAAGASGVLISIDDRSIHLSSALAITVEINPVG